MSWKMMDLAVKHLNVNALREWKDTVLGMSIWMQAVVVGVLALLIGASLLSLFWGLKMNRSARFAAGSSSVFMITLIILVAEYSTEDQKAFIISAIAGVAGGFLYAFLERIFQFAAGFVFGTVLATWLLPVCFHMKLNTQPGRVWRLIIAIAVGVVFALLAKKLKFILTALEGGVVLGLLADAFLPVTKIPWISEKLTKNQILNLLPMVIAAVGVLVQLGQWIAEIRERKALQIPTGDETNSDRSSAASSQEKPSEEKPEGDTAQAQEVISMAAAEEVLVEKAKELALAASKSVQNARLKERYEDVAEGLYTPEVAAGRLGITEEEFLEGMKKSGYSLKSEEGEKKDVASDDMNVQEGKTEDDTDKAVSLSETAGEDEKADSDVVDAVKTQEEKPEEEKPGEEKPGEDTGKEVSGTETAGEDENAGAGASGDTTGAPAENQTGEGQEKDGTSESAQKNSDGGNKGSGRRKHKKH